MNTTIDQKINNFINKAKDIFGENLIIGYEYCKELDIYNIWHNDSDLDFDENSSIIINNLIEEHFPDFYDFCFAYDFDKSKSLK